MLSLRFKMFTMLTTFWQTLKKAVFGNSSSLQPNLTLHEVAITQTISSKSLYLQG